METRKQKANMLMVGLYAWIIAVNFGATQLDILYGRWLSQPINAISEASDFLLLVSSFTVFAGLFAIAVSWKSTTARNIFIASLLVASLEFVIPAFLSGLLRNAQNMNIGPWLRLLPTGLGSILAFVGMYHFYRQP